METSVKTAHGISSQKYGTLHDHLPHHGMGQGNGGGPPIYDTVSAMIITIMTSLGFGTRFLSPISRNKLKYTGFEYVDDGDNSETARNPEESGEEVAKRMQEGITVRNGCLRTTGGLILAEKTWAYVIDFKWNHGTDQYMTKEDLPFDFFLEDDHGCNHKLA